MADRSAEERGDITWAVENLLSPGSAPLGPNLEDEEAKRRMFDGLLDVWRGRASPTVIVSDDLHWADLASIELLIHLFQLVEEAPIVFLNIMRPERHSPGWKVKEEAGTGYSHLHTEVTLGPLSDEDNDALIGNPPEYLGPAVRAPSDDSR